MYAAQHQVATVEKRLTPVGFNQMPATNLTGSITAATKANPCVITSAAHGLLTGQRLTIAGVVGMTQLNGSTIYTITKIDANSFSLDGVDSTLFTTYTNGGTWSILAVGLGFGLASNAIPTGAEYALVQAEAQNLRWRDDGTDPTTTVGMLLASGSTILIKNTDLTAVKLMRAVSAGIINITFYKEGDY